MSRYYYNVQDGHTSLDDESQELARFADARQLAIVHSGEILRDGAGAGLSRGKPWRMWVTDAPGGQGKTFFTLKFSAADGDGMPP
jgi:hypothetical protein